MSTWCAWDSYGDCVASGYSYESVARQVLALGYDLGEVLIMRFTP